MAGFAELAPAIVAVIAGGAGWVDAGPGHEMIEAKLTSEIKQMMIEGIPLKRMGLPQEIVDAAVFIASSRAAFITGVSLTVDGGQHL
jgi:3-oxoacyl-[acyl-carrier protein] reductase